MTSLTWASAIYPDFQELMDTDIAGTTYRTWTEFKLGVDLKKANASIHDGAYTISYGGTPALDFEVNSEMGYNHVVILSLGFRLNMMDTTRTDYNNAINDIETIIKKRLTSSTWGIGIDMIEFSRATPFNFPLGDQMYAVTEIEFRVRARTTL